MSEGNVNDTVEDFRQRIKDREKRGENEAYSGHESLELLTRLEGGGVEGV